MWPSMRRHVRTLAASRPARSEPRLNLLHSVPRRLASAVPAPASGPGAGLTNRVDDFLASEYKKESVTVRTTNMEIVQLSCEIGDPGPVSLSPRITVVLCDMSFL